MTTITKTTSSKNVDRYRSTTPQRIDSEVVVITGYGRSMDDSGKYIHRMAVRPATAEETDAVVLAEKIAEMSEALTAMRGNELDAEIAGTHDEWQAAYRVAQSAYLAARKLVK